MTSPSTRTLAVAVAISATLGISACSGDSTSTTASSTTIPTSVSAAQATDTAVSDILYLQRMAQFERQATSLARLALDRSDDEQVRALAQQAKDQRVATANRIDVALTRLGSQTPVKGSSEGLGWPGMLTSTQMAAVLTAPEADFDALWLTALIQTDREAVTISSEVMHGQGDAEVHQLATDEITMLTEEYQAASRLAGPAPSRKPLPN